MKALVLCAGRGTRLKQLTRDMPKALLPVAGKPLIVHIVEWLASEGIHEVLINLHYRAEMIPEALARAAIADVNLYYTREAELLGTAGTIKANQSWFTGNVVVVYGDVITDQPLAHMLRQHRHRNADVTLLVHKRARSNSEIQMREDRRIVSFEERPNARRSVSSSWVFSGIQILNPSLLTHIPSRVPADLPRDVYEPFPQRVRMYGYPLSGRRVAVDSPDRLNDASRLFATPALLDRTPRHQASS